MEEEGGEKGWTDEGGREEVISPRFRLLQRRPLRSLKDAKRTEMEFHIPFPIPIFHSHIPVQVPYSTLISIQFPVPNPGGKNGYRQDFRWMSSGFWTGWTSGGHASEIRQISVLSAGIRDLELGLDMRYGNGIMD